MVLNNSFELFAETHERELCINEFDEAIENS